MTAVEALLQKHERKKEKERASKLKDAGGPDLNAVDRLEIQQSINHLIASKAIVVFSKSYCPYCRQAKMAFRSIPNLDFEVVEMDDGAHYGWQTCVAEIAKEKAVIEAANNDTTSVPQIFIHQKYIGGADDLADMFGDHRLTQMLGRHLD